MSRIYRVIFIFFLLLLSTQSIFAGRYYDSETGRWLSVDPKADKYPGWSPYNYTLNNPLINIDPDGKEPITLTTTGVVVAGAVTIALVGHTYNYLTNSSYRRSYNSFSSSVGEVVSETATGIWEGVTNLFSSDKSKPKENTKIGPYDGDVNIVDNDGNVIPLKEGQTLEGNPEGSMTEVKDKDGKPTGDRKHSDGHPKQKDPKAKNPHGHRVDENGNPITDNSGNPHLPINTTR